VATRAISPVAGRDIIDLVGNTPLLGFRRVTSELGAGTRVLAKAEWYNPGGSIKDRAALSMVLDGERRGCSRRTRSSSTPPAATPASPTR
jgi:cysteine synthase B